MESKHKIMFVQTFKIEINLLINICISVTYIKSFNRVLANHNHFIFRTDNSWVKHIISFENDRYRYINTSVRIFGN